MTDENDTVTTQLPTPGAGPRMQMVEVALIEESLTNPRKTFDQVKLGELAASIAASGVHQPVLLRPLPGTRLAETFGFRRQGAPLPVYELICGARRLRATLIAKVAEIPAMIRELSDDQVLEIQIIENLQRDDLSPLEEAEGYEKLMEHSKLNADQVAEKVGKSRSYVYGRIKLLDLCSAARDVLREGKMDASKALLIARIPDQKLQIEATGRIAKEDYAGSVMSYRAAASLVQEHYMLRLDKAKFPITDADLQPGAGPCGSCPKRTGHQPELFADVKSADVCTDPTCYKAKEDAHNIRLIEAARAKGQTVIAADESQDLLHEHGSYFDAKFKGYKRLDRVDDSPTDKPLRKILEKAMQAEGITPVMIENPRKKGELEACLPNETVSRLLKQAEGQAQAAKAVSTEVKEVLDAKKAKAEARAKAKYEAEWRQLLIARCWERMQKTGNSIYTLDLHRYDALAKANSLRTEDIEALCELLGLGKVSPSTALRDYIKETPDPDFVHMLLVAQQDSDPNDYDSKYTGRKANEGMHLTAKAIFGDEVATVLKEVKKEAAAACLPPPEPLPTPEATPAKTERKGKKSKNPAAPAGVDSAKTSKEEATASIAAALEAAEKANQGAADASQGNEQAPVADALGPVAGAEEAAADISTGAPLEVGPGVTVKVNSSVPIQQGKFVGKTGVVDRKMGDSAWWVIFNTPRLKAQASFDTSELDVVATAAIAPEEEPAALPAAEPEGNACTHCPALEVGQTVKVKATATNRKWRGREGVLLSRKTKDPTDTDPMWMVRQGVPPKHADCSFFASDLEPVDQEAAS